MALEDLAGEYPVTRMMMRRAQSAPMAPPSNVLEALGETSRETGEAVAAVLQAQQSQDSGDWVAAARETDEAMEALRRQRAAIDAQLQADRAAEPVTVPVVLRGAAGQMAGRA